MAAAFAAGWPQAGGDTEVEISGSEPVINSGEHGRTLVECPDILCCPPQLDRIIRFRSPFDTLLDDISVTRSRRTDTKKRPSEAWVAAAARLSEDAETATENEVAEALFDLANMFAAAEPVLKAEEEGGSSPAARSDGGHARKRQRVPKGGKATQAAVPSHHQQQHQQQNGRYAPQGFPDGHDAAAVADYGLVAQLAAAQRGDESAAAAVAAAAAAAGWDSRSPAANGLGGLAAAQLAAGGGFPASTPGGLSPGLAGFYPPAGLPPLAVTLPQGGGGWGGSSVATEAPDTKPRTAFPRCASHVYIAHLIEFQTKLERERGAAAAAAGGGGYDVLQGKPEGFYKAGAAPPPGFPNGSAHFEDRAGGAAVKQEPGSAGRAGGNSQQQPPQHHQQPQHQNQHQQQHGQQFPPGLPLSGGLLFGSGAPATMAMAGARGGPGAPGPGPAAALAQQQQHYAQQLSQLAMLSQQSGAGFPPFLPPSQASGGLGPAGFGAAGMPPQQPPFFGQQSFPNINLASLLPPNLAHLATSADPMELLVPAESPPPQTGMQPDMSGLSSGLEGLMKHSPPSAQVNDVTGGLPPSATRAEAEAWAAKLAAAASQQQQQTPPPQQQQEPPQQAPNGVPNGGNGGYPTADVQFKLFQEVIANAERDRKMRTTPMQA